MSLALTDADPIASEIGHGAMGLRENLRPFSELKTQSVCQRHVFCSFKPGKMVTGWTQYNSGGAPSAAWYVVWSEVWAGILRDVVGVQTLTETLTRVESVADCVATAGTYYLDPRILDPESRWGGAGIVWGGALWPTYPLLFVHLTAGADPTATSVKAQLLFGESSHAVAQPTFGPEKLANGGVESWASASDANSWSEITSGGGTVAQDAGIDGVGAYSAKCGGTLAAAGFAGLSQGSMRGVANAIYRISGWYKTTEGLPAGVVPYLEVRDGTVSVARDGRSTTTLGTAFAFTGQTNGSSRRFFFDFVCPNTTAAGLAISIYLFNASGLPVTGHLWLDGLSVRRIWRFEPYEARLDMDSLPEIEEKRPDAFFGSIARGTGTITLINGNGHFEGPFGGLDWIYAEFEARSGGRFPDGGNEILFEDMPVVLAGIVTQRPELTDTKFSLPFEDFMTYWSMLLPEKVFDVDTYPSLATRDASQRVPLIFSSASEVRPAARVSKGTGANLGLPIYKLIDMEPAVANGAASIFLNSYVDEDAALRQDSTQRVIVSCVSAYDGATGLWSATADARPIVIVAGKNDALTFIVAGTGYTGVVPPGIYAWGGYSTQSLAPALRTALNAAGAGAIFNLPTYDLSTGGKATFTASVAFQVARASDPWIGATLWPELGFTAQADTGAAASQTSDTGMFVDCDQQIPAPRIDSVTGYKDDASGTYTGSAGGVIDLAPDIVHFLLRRLGGVPAERIGASFVSTRATLTTHLFLYLGGPQDGEQELSLIIQRIENTVGADVVFTNGKFEIVKRDNTVPADIVDLGESDYLDFASSDDAEGYFKIVKVGYAEEASASGRWQTKQTTTASVKLRLGRDDQKTFFTYIQSADSAVAATRLAAFVAEATAKHRRFAVIVKGKLFGRALCSKARLTRAKGMDSTGALDHVLCRILSKRDNMVTQTTVAELIEVI